ncbi:uncharacterized protein K02A2.6-like, partial [Heteronotia binoei]|uniref:uncharacterized protein K02A2.6-like n=1 Tax=Heteronotia binoei TaxID=13085 RepID=UPI00292E7634
RRVPFTLKPKIEEELDKLIAQGILEPVTHATWETPIVTPVKPSGEVRICADYKCTLNKALQAHAYPVPIVSHVLATLAGAKIFGKLDLAQAYQQLPVDEATANAQTIVTHRGAFRVKRLQFGVSVAPGLFQELMDDELSTHKGCLLWGNRVVIPKPLQVQVLRALHEAHPGIVRMKALARSYVWWPGLDAEIEAWVKRCPTCQVSRPDPPRGPVQSWESTKTPWSRLHMDFAGPFHGWTLLILVDSYSKWLEVVQVPSPSSQATITALRAIFATHGLPETIVTDNGTAFTSAVFQDFLARNLIRQIRSAPFHPATNGQA